MMYDIFLLRFVREIVILSNIRVRATVASNIARRFN